MLWAERPNAFEVEAALAADQLIHVLSSILSEDLLIFSQFDSKTDENVLTVNNICDPNRESFASRKIDNFSRDPSAQGTNLSRMMNVNDYTSVHINKCMSMQIELPELTPPIWQTVGESRWLSELQNTCRQENFYIWISKAGKESRTHAFRPSLRVMDIWIDTRTRNGSEKYERVGCAPMSGTEVWE